MAGAGASAARRGRVSRWRRQASKLVNRGVPRFVIEGENEIISANSDSWPAEELVRAHHGRLRRLCELMLGDREEAEEIVQDTFMKAYEASMGPSAPSDWSAWLTRVAVNACRDRRRAGWWMRFRRWTDRVEEMALPALEPDPADAATSGETRRQIWLAFRELPDRQRVVFVLRHIEEYSTSEVADALGLSAGSVKRHLFRAIRKLRGALGDMR